MQLPRQLRVRRTDPDDSHNDPFRWGKARDKTVRSATSHGFHERSRRLRSRRDPRTQPRASESSSAVRGMTPDVTAS